ncbi:MAG: acetolactate synthase small subunit, partial [Alphaproteobacteria bacterium]|nr:acetolactate synthase small subunit [Candidatus Fonsibacter sp. PEL55]
RPGPVLVDIPKDIQFQKTEYVKKKDVIQKINKVVNEIDSSELDKIIDLIYKSKKPIIYSGGGVVNSGDKASVLLQDLVRLTGFPITSTLQGLGAFPGDDQQFLGMLGMHGTYEANNAMHDCDLMINIGARFDDRITGKIDKFSPGSKKIHIDIDPSSINKIIKVDHAVVGDVENVLNKLITVFKKKYPNFKNSNKENISEWWKQINKWKEKNCLSFVQEKKTIKPQYAIKRLYELTKDQDTFITTEVGQHQMWAAQYYKFKKPKRWMTSGGLGTMGFGLPAAIGVQLANPGKLVVDVAGEASILMNIQELSTAVQYKLPVKIFIINNQYMGMVRQWQELLHEKNYAESYTAALPDFVKLAEAYGATGIRATKPEELDLKIKEMIKSDKPVLFDCVVDKIENCFPMIPSGKAHNEMILEKNISRITIATNGTNSVIEQIKAQLLKLIPVYKVASFPVDDKSIFRELALIKVIADKKNLEKAKEICNSHKAQYLDTTSTSFIVEFHSTRREIDSFIRELKPFGIASVARTGPLAMAKGAEITETNKGKVI